MDFPVGAKSPGVRHILDKIVLFVLFFLLLLQRWYLPRVNDALEFIYRDFFVVGPYKAAEKLVSFFSSIVMVDVVLCWLGCCDVVLTHI